MDFIWGIIDFNYNSGDYDKIEKRQMNINSGQFFIKRINTISKYLFWIYFLIIIGYYYLIDDSIPTIMSYLFWALLGLRVGTVVTIKSMTLDNKQKTDKLVDITDRDKNAL